MKILFLTITIVAVFGCAQCYEVFMNMEKLTPSMKIRDEAIAQPSVDTEQSRTNYLRSHWSVEQLWDAWKHVYRKEYTSEYEEQRRYKIFVEKYNNVIQHNELYRKGLVSYDIELNRFSDMPSMEVKAAFNGFNRKLRNASFPVHDRLPIPLMGSESIDLPRNVDWRGKAVTPVKDQGHCGSCWSFSATGALEGQHFMKTGRLVSLSEQNLVDCSTKWGNNGCEGGLMDQAFQYVKDNGGIDLENSYPYQAVDGHCHFNRQFIGATDKGFMDIPSGNERALMHAVAHYGPVSVAIDASHPSFHDYSMGVYSEPECGNTPDSLDHGVLVVGYGTDPSTRKDFWIIKNSWSSMWGDSGYIKMARNENNMCGVATMASVPRV